MFEHLVNGLLAYGLHSTALIGAALLAERAGLLRRLRPAQAELVWRWALFGPLLTAGVPLLLSLALQAHPTEAAPHVAATASAAITSAAPEPTRVSLPAIAAPAPQHRTESSTDWLPTAVSATTLLWLAGAMATLSLLGASAWWLNRELRRLPINRDAALNELVSKLSRRAGLRTPRLRVASRWSSPLLTPGGTICLPRWAEALPPAQREAVLAHELAHLLRRDPAWRVAAQVLCCVAWLQPLNRVVMRRLDTLAELACDAWAARLTGSPLPLAESLLQAAEVHQASHRAHRSPRLAMAMSDTRSALVQRLHRLLKEDTMSEEKPTTRKTRWGIAAGVLIVALAVPAIAVHSAATDGLMADLLHSIGGITHAVFRNGDTTRIETRGPEGRLVIDIHGKPQFSDDDENIVAMQGRLDVLDKRDGHVRHLLMVGAPEQPAQRVLELDGHVVTTPDAADRAWLADTTDLIIQSTVSADEQVKRLMARGGVDTVLARIERVHFDNGRSALIQALIHNGAQSPATVDRLLADTAGIGGDFERRSALHALASQPLAESQQIAWLQRTAEIGSDFECREALNSLAPQVLDSAPVLAAWLAAFKTIGSDFEARNAIEALMAQPKVSPALVNAALTASINVGSDFERREALISLVKTGALKREGFDAVLDATAGINSDFEAMTVLQAVAQAMPADAALVTHYRKIARRLPDFERGQAEKALDHLDV